MTKYRLLMIAIALTAVAGCTRTVAKQGDGTPPCSRVPIVLASSPSLESQMVERTSLTEPALSPNVPGDPTGRHIGFLVSVSETMREKMPIAVDALQTFLNVLDPQDEAFLLKFGIHLTLLQESTRNHALLRNALQEMHVTSNAFPVSRGTKEVLKALPLVQVLTLPFDLTEKYQTRDLEFGAKLYDATLAGVCLVRQGQHSRRAIVLITDGRNLLSSFSLADVLSEIGGVKIPIYSILIGDPDARWWGRTWATMDINTAHTLSEKTSGTHFIINYNNPQASKLAISKALEKISEELRQPISEGFTYVYNEQLQVFEKVSLAETKQDAGQAP